jgi:hypothetical protein
VLVGQALQDKVTTVVQGLQIMQLIEMVAEVEVLLL